jgi:hypothetical protein
VGIDWKRDILGNIYTSKDEKKKAAKGSFALGGLAGGALGILGGAIGALVMHHKKKEQLLDEEREKNNAV